MSNRRNRATLVPIEQDTVPFHGHELIAVRLPDGQIAVILRWLCDSLQLDPQGQQQRIERKTALADGLVNVRVDTVGGPQDMQALTLDVLPGYLFTIDENRVKAEARADVVLFQRECVKVLADYFARKRPATAMAFSTPQSPALIDAQLTSQVAQVSEQIDTLSGALNMMREHLVALLALPEQVAGVAEQLDETRALIESLVKRQNTTDAQIARIDERTQRLTPAHARAIQEQVDRMIHDTRRLPIPLTYPIIYGRLKHRFRASSYREIADDQYEAVLGWLRDELRRALAGEAPEQGSLF